MKRLVLMIALALLYSCGLEQVDEGTHSSSDGIWRGPSYGKHLSGTVYAAGLDYPDAYDWRADTEKGKVKCSMALFADGIPVLKVPVGDAHEVSSDIGRHRIRAGNLYTDYTDGNTTVLKKDGKEIARYEGAEDIICMEVHAGKVYSLSRPSGGEGFRYRVDGSLVLERSDGVPYPHLTVHQDSVRFCFCQSQRTAEGSQMRYYQVSDGIVRQVEVPEGVSRVWDMMVSDGKVAMVLSLPDRSPVLMHDGKEEYVEYLGRQKVVSCTFCDSGRLSVCVRCRYSGDNLMSDILWTADDGWTMYRIGRTLACFHVDEERCNAVINPADGRDGIIFSGRTASVMPQGYSVFSKECMTRRDSVLYVGLSSGGEAPPLVWRNGAADTLRINGPLTCLR